MCFLVNSMSQKRTENRTAVFELCGALTASVGYGWESKIIRFKAGVRWLSLGVSIFVYRLLSSAPPPLLTLQTKVQHCSFQPGNVKGACSQKWTDKCKTTAELFFLLSAILVCYFHVELWKEERWVEWLLWEILASCVTVVLMDCGRPSVTWLLQGRRSDRRKEKLCWVFFAGRCLQQRHAAREQNNSRLLKLLFWKGKESSTVHFLSAQAVPLQNNIWRKKISPVIFQVMIIISSSHPRECRKPEIKSRQYLHPYSSVFQCVSPC